MNSRRSIALLVTGIQVFACASAQTMQKLSASDGVVNHNAAIKLRPSYQECIDGSFAATPSLLKCADDEFSFQDRRLNDVYKRLMNSSTPESKAVLRAEEREWLTMKKSRCSAGDQPGQGDEVAAADCDVGETAKRATELEARLSK